MALTQTDIARVKALGFLRNRGTELFSGRIVPAGGVFTVEELAAAAELAARFGNGKVAPTTRMTLEIVGIPYEQIDQAIAFGEALGLRFGGTGAKVRPVTACKGTTCVFGSYDTQALGREIHQRYYLGWDKVALPHKFKIAVGGCPNSCIKPSLNDFGIEGRRTPEGATRSTWAAPGAGTPGWATRCPGWWNRRRSSPFWKRPCCGSGKTPFRGSAWARPSTGWARRPFSPRWRETVYRRGGRPFLPPRSNKGRNRPLPAFPRPLPSSAQAKGPARRFRGAQGLSFPVWVLLRICSRCGIASGAHRCNGAARGLCGRRAHPSNPDRRPGAPGSHGSCGWAWPRPAGRGRRPAAP